MLLSAAVAVPFVLYIVLYVSAPNLVSAEDSTIIAGVQLLGPVRLHFFNGFNSSRTGRSPKGYMMVHKSGDMMFLSADEPASESRARMLYLHCWQHICSDVL